jgi:hypothetical protein
MKAQRAIDVAEVEAALKRAAKTAVTGSPRERSGRFFDARDQQAPPSAKTKPSGLPVRKK